MFSLCNPQYIGRNYLQDTYWNRSGNQMTIEDGIVTSVCSYIYPRVSNQIGLYLDIKKGEQWTLSFDALVPDEEEIKINLTISNPQSDSAEGTGFIGWLVTPKYTKGEWSHIKTSFVAKDDILDTTRLYFWYHVSFQEGVPEDAEKFWIKLKNVKLERGGQETKYTPALENGEVDFIKPNLVNGTSENWSSWITPRYNKGSMGVSFYSGIYLPDSIIDDNATFSIEMELEDISFTPEEEQIPDNGIVYKPQLSFFIKPVASNYTYMVQKNFKYFTDDGNGVRRYIYKNGIHEKYPEIVKEWGRNLEFGLIYHWLASGRFRYRNFLIKPDVPNPIYCKSEMDLANPNLIKSTRVVISWKEEDAEDYYETLPINDLKDNPYITEGYLLKSIPENQWIYVNMGCIEDLIDKTVTASAYVRLKSGDLRRAYFQGGGTPGSGYLETADVTPITKEWTRVSAVLHPTISINTLALVFFTQTSEVEVCGFKIEEGDKLTAWTPYSASTLELDPGELLIL